MPELKLKVPLLSGGISRQPAHIRLPGQVEDAVNAAFTVIDGASNRPSTSYVGKIANIPIAGNYRLHPIVRDDVEKYLVVYGNGVLRVFETSGQEATVTILAGAQTYLDLNNASADQLRLVTIADSTFILNTTVACGKTGSGATEKPDQTKMPIRLRRTAAAVPSANGYSATVLAASPWAYWKLNEQYADMPPFPASNICYNAQGNQARNGLYIRDTGQGQIKLKQPGMTTEPGNTGARFINSHATLGAFVAINSASGLAALMAAGVTVEAIVKKPSDSPNGGGTILGLHKNTGNPNSAVICTANFSTDNVALRLNNADSSKERLFTAANAGVSDGNYHHVVFAYDPVGDSALCVVDGVSKAVTVTTSVGTSPTNFDDFVYRRIGADNISTHGLAPFAGIIDSMALYARPFTLGEAQTHYNKIIAADSYQPATFQAELNTWDPRPSGDATSNPLPSVFIKQAKLSDIAYHRDRLVLTGDEDVVFSQAGALFNFFINNASNVVESDPIDVPIGSERINLIDTIVAYRGTLFIAAKSGRQFELSHVEVLSQATVSITPTTNYATIPGIRPVASKNKLYFLGRENARVSLHEYSFDERTASSDALNLSDHVDDLIVEPVKTLAASANHGAVFVLPTDVNYLFLHQSFWDSGGVRQQSAWTRYQIDADTRIIDIAVLNEDLYLLVQLGEQFLVERMPIARPRALDGFPFPPVVDRAYFTTGTYDAGDDETTWTLPFVDSGIDIIVLSSDFPVPGGIASGQHGGIIDVLPGDGNPPDPPPPPDPPDAELTVTAPDTGRGGEGTGTTTIVVQGDYSGGIVCIGHLVDGSVELTRPFARDFNGLAHIDGRISLRKITVAHKQTGDYTLKATMPLRGDRTKAFAAAITTLEEAGTKTAWFNGELKSMRLFITHKKHRPWAISSVEYIADFESRMN